MTQQKRQETDQQTRDEKELAKREAERKNVTASTKDTLEWLDAEIPRIRAKVANRDQQREKSLSFLPRAKERFAEEVQQLANPSQRQIEPMREKIQSLVGEIRLHPTRQGYLEAEMPRRYEGLLKLVVGGNRNASGCGGRI